MTRVHRLLTAVAAALLLGSACAREIVGEPPPLDRPHFPRGLALHPERPLLAVVSSNFDLEFNRGAILLADLAQVDAAIAAAEGDVVRLQGETSPYTDVALIPSFGNEPVFVLDGSRMLLPSQEQNRVSEIPLSFEDDEVAFDCAVTEEAERPVPLCGEPELSVQLPGNDPFEIAVVDESDTRARAIVTLLNSPDVFYVTLDVEESPTRRLNIARTAPSFTLEGYAGDELDVLGVRGIALRPAQDGVPTTAFLTVSRTSRALTNRAVDLVWFDATQGAPSSLDVVRLTDEIGSIDARDVAVAPDGEALFVILRDPDAIARVDLFPSGGAVEARIGGVVSACYDPIEIEAITLPAPTGGEVTRVLVTCFDNDTVVAYHPLSLVETEVLRGFGDGPYGLVVDLEHAPPRAYVGFFNDDRVGVIDLVDDDGEVRMVPRALIGERRDDVEAAE